MGQLTQQIIYFNDSAGVILPGSRHFFYEAGTTTPQTVYSDKELTTPIVQPVLADTSGILEQIWLQPLPYRWIGQDANSVQLFDRDDVNFAENVINTSSSFVFSTVANMALGILINGESIDLQDGQSASTQGSVTAKDGLGEYYIIEAVDPGGSVALNNGRFATELDNFQNSGDVNAKIDAHNTAVGGTHADIRTEIDTDIDAHNTAVGGTHADIRTEIDNDISTHDGLALGAVHTLLMSGHNADALAHEPLRDRLDNLETTQGLQGDDITTNVNDITDVTTDLATHESLITNPHLVTNAQVGLGDVANYGNSDSPFLDQDNVYATSRAVHDLGSKTAEGEGITICFIVTIVVSNGGVGVEILPDTSSTLGVNFFVSTNVTDDTTLGLVEFQLIRSDQFTYATAFAHVASGSALIGVAKSTVTAQNIDIGGGQMRETLSVNIVNMSGTAQSNSAHVYVNYTFNG